jgi:hypothetical protein
MPRFLHLQHTDFDRKVAGRTFDIATLGAMLEEVHETWPASWRC